MQLTDTPGLRSECDSCGAPDALLRRRIAEENEYLCVPCARQDALSIAAFEQLEVLIGHAMHAWQQDWPDEATTGIGELINQIGRKLEERMAAPRPLADRSA